MSLSPDDLKNDGFGTLIKKLNESSGGGGSGNGIIVWSSARIWEEVYADINTAGGRAIVLVLNDGAHEMTPNLAGPTDLSSVLFVGIRDADGNLPQIDIDSAGVGGFALGGNCSLHSKDVNWLTYYRIVETPTTWEFDGGGLASATADNCFRAEWLNLVLRNGAIIDGSSCTVGLFTGLRTGVSVHATDGCVLGDKCFYANVGVPPWSQITLHVDSSVTVSAALIGGSAGVNVTQDRIDKALLVDFDDTSEPSNPTSQGTAQDVIDWVKRSVSGPGRLRVDYWRGSETWEEVYQRFVMNADGGILFVWHDGATPRDMTPNPTPGGETDLNNVWFVGIQQADGSLPTIRVDPANLGTFKLTSMGNLRTKDLHWVFPVYQIAVGSPIYRQTRIEVDGGSFTTVPLSAGVWQALSIKANLRNGALLDGSNCDVGKALIELAPPPGFASDVYVETLATLGTQSIVSASGHNLALTKDASGIVSPTAISGVLSVTTALMDKAVGVAYNDGLVPPALGATEVQGAIDALKGGAVPLSNVNPQPLGAAAPGAGTSSSRDDHVHEHGNQAGGLLHPAATTLVAGFMSPLDKIKLDGLAPGPGGGFVAPIDTLLNLAALDASGLVDGAQIYVNEVEDIYVLEKATTHTPDGLVVLAATGGGYWVARTVGRWDDVQGSISDGAGSALLTLEFFRDTRFNMYFMRHDQDDEISFTYQFTHRWKYDTEVRPHLHIVPAANPAAPQVARFDGYYVWTRPNYVAAPLPALSGWTPFGPVNVTINPGDQWVQKIIPLGAWTPPVWARESTSLLIYFRRNGTNVGDTYTTNKTGGTPAANLGIISTDVHYRLRHSGTETEIPT